MFFINFSAFYEKYFGGFFVRNIMCNRVINRYLWVDVYETPQLLNRAAIHIKDINRKCELKSDY